ncbi:hypothetical protein, conserved [Eimeria praecox]|uniref:Uncharacterized protein n=1 Tax=Eimeria praecox TaxID=51316 RepID=U6H877_9EIME|nr:hypothetical protein, conserved [Eimeria praecox]
MSPRFSSVYCIFVCPESMFEAQAEATWRQQVKAREFQGEKDKKTAQAEATWRQQVKAREFQGEKDKKTESKEEFEKWKEENRRGIENILRTAFAIQAVYQKEGLQVDETKLQRDLAKAMLQVKATHHSIV